WTPKVPEKVKHDGGFSGEPISLNLKQADIRDVMATFAQITGLKIIVEPEVQGTVTMNVTGVPWDKALLDAAIQVGAKAIIQGKTIRITK
ncbi:MAG TPA: hypothetical protein VHK90_08045, partial [Thermoanaerobaculia bacterium]|nr:hypothetical protein [Thermoanaerobaculia bacterium]